MKKLILLLFIPLVFACSDDKKKDLDEMNLKGKVKSLKETSYSAVEKFGEPVKDEFTSQTESFFNEDGFYKEYNFFNKSGELTEKQKYKSDDDGNIVESNWYDADGELLSKSKYKYDDDGNIVESNRYDKDGELLSKWKYKYEKFDKNKNWLTKISYEDGKATEIIEREIEYYD